MNRKFICVMKCIESEPEKIYFDIYGIGRIKEMSTGLLIQLNLCNEIYETSDVKNNFDYDLYFGTRDLLLKEMGFNLEDLFD